MIPWLLIYAAAQDGHADTQYVIFHVIMNY